MTTNEWLAIAPFVLVVGLAMLVVLFCTVSFVNLVGPNANALALTRHGEVAGTAAAFSGSLQALIGGAVTPLSGLLGGDARAMTSVMVTAAVLGLVVLAVATPAFHRTRRTEALVGPVA